MTGNLPNNKDFLLAKYLGYMPNDYTLYQEEGSLSTLRNPAFSNSTLYVFHSIGEEAISMITLLAQLKHMKVQKTGKSLYDHYVLEQTTTPEGATITKVKWDGTVRGKKRMSDGSLQDLTELDGNELKRMFYVYEVLHGGYREDERTALEYTIFGELFMQFKKYLPSLLKNMFKSKGTVPAWGYYRFEGDPKDPNAVVEWHSRVMEGRWQVLAGLLLNAIPFKQKLQDENGMPTRYAKIASFLGLDMSANESYKWSNLNEYQKSVVFDAVYTLA